MSKDSRPAVLGLIGNTPLVQVTRFDTGPCTLFLKLESQNPGGSIKDRIGLAMIDAAERDGRLKPGGTIVEATAGNTGLGLALVGRAKGYRVVLVVPDKMSTEKVLHLKAMGAEVHITRSDVGKGHPEYYQDVAARLAKDIPGAFFADQFNNPANPLAHECSTAPEIWAQTEHDLDAIVVGVGSAGTLTGLTRFFKRVQPDLQMVLADPVGSVMAQYSRDGSLPTPVRGRSKASAKTSFRRSPTSPACATRIRSATKKASITPVNYSKPKAFSAARRPVPCSPPRCVIAANKPSQNAWSVSFATPARATCRRSTTTNG